MGNCHSQPSSKSKPARNATFIQPSVKLKAIVTKPNPPAPPYTTTPSEIPPCYLQLYLHSTSPYGSLIFRRLGYPKVLYEVYNPHGIHRRCNRKCRVADPDLQIINMASSLIVGTVRWAVRGDDISHGQQNNWKRELNFPRTGRTTLYDPDGSGLESKHGNGGDTGRLIFKRGTDSETSTHAYRLDCEDGDGACVFWAEVKGKEMQSATIEVVKICQESESLDEIVVCAVAWIEDLRRTRLKIEQALVESGFEKDMLRCRIHDGD